MIFGCVVTNTGFVKVPIHVQVQRSGLPQLILQGIPGPVRGLRQKLLNSWRAKSVSLPRGKVVIECQVPANVRWGVNGLATAVFQAVAEKAQNRSQRDLVVAGELDLTGYATLPQSLAGVLGWQTSEKRLVGSFPQAWSDLVQGEVDIFQNQAQFSSGSLDPKSNTQQNLLPLDSLHSLVLALVWAGGHHALLFGSPGEGKTRSRSWLEAMAPNLSHSQRLFHHQLQDINPLLTRQAPVLAPPATASLKSWTEQTRHSTGWLFRAAYGCIWQDEGSQTSRAVRTRWRAWLEQQESFPLPSGADWSPAFVMTTNPCPCGYWGEPRCVCSSQQVARVFQNLSWPLLDRFPLQWRTSSQLESNQDLVRVLEDHRQRIALARNAQTQRRQRVLNARCDIWQLTQSVQDVVRQWEPFFREVSIRRQVQFGQVIQTLLDGAWADSAQTAAELAWQLCRGSEAFRQVKA